MIAITRSAAQAVRRMTNTETYPRAGLSIKKFAKNKYAMSIVPAPADNDVAVSGTNIYLDRPAAVELENATLDAAVDATFAEQFILKM